MGEVYRAKDTNLGQTLFLIPGTGPVAYDVARDGRRFQINFADVERTSVTPRPLTLLTNWTASLGQR
jgi:hypothetical protein